MHSQECSAEADQHCFEVTEQSMRLSFNTFSSPVLNFPNELV